MFAARGGFFRNSFGTNLDITSGGGSLSTPASGATPTALIDWTATTGFTVEYWVYNTALPGSLSPGPGNSNGVNTNYWSFGPASAGLTFYFFNGSVNYIVGPALALNTWYNISAVCTTVSGSTTVTLYVNGVRQNTTLNGSGSASSQTVTGGTYDTATPFSFGRYGNNFLSSFVDNLRVSNINRYSGASYTVSNYPVTLDSNTQLMILPTDSVGSYTISYQSVVGNGTMSNLNNIITVTNLHFNHT